MGSTKRDGFAGVVQQDREIEQLGLVQLAEYAGVAFVPFGFGLPQAVQNVDGLESVFIHREAMGNIADGERVNSLQLRQEKGQQMEGMHCVQRVRGMQFRQHIFQKQPKIGAAWRIRGQSAASPAPSGARP